MLSEQVCCLRSGGTLGLLFLIFCLSVLKEGFEESTIDFITNVLLHHKGPIHTFEMSYSYNFNFERVEEWVLCLSRNDIRELIIKISSDVDCGGNSLKSSVYSCTNLTKLVLWNFTMDPPPSTFKGFLFLTCLVLLGADLSPDGVETLISNCPLLEKLTLMHCVGSELRIRSPNLKVLHVAGDYTELCLYAPLLDIMYVDLTASQFKCKHQRLVCNYTDFFGGFTNLVELTGHECFIRYLSFGIESCHTTLVFHHLKVIRLSGVNFEVVKETSVVARLIIGAPNLHKLEIVTRPWYEDGAPDVSFKDYLKFEPNFILEKLKDVSLKYVCHYSFGMQLVKFLLETSPMLETMEVHLEDRTRFDEVSAELLEFRRASPDAKISLISLTDG